MKQCLAYVDQIAQIMWCSKTLQWVEEKTSGRWKAEDVASVSIEILREGGPSAVCDYLCKLPQVPTLKQLQITEKRTVLLIYHYKYKYTCCVSAKS